jgi:hypothetical protein
MNDIQNGVRYLQARTLMKAALSLAIISLALPCKAVVIQHDAKILEPNSTVPSLPFRSFTVTSAPFFHVEISNSGLNEFTFRYQGIADAYSLFRVTSGIDFDAAYVNSQPAFVNNWGSPGTGLLTLAANQSAYLAYWDQGSGPPRLTARDTDLFGWALVTNSGGTLIISDSATAVGGGIITGTLQQIPEPAAMWSVAGGLALFFLRRRRTK